MIRLEIGYNPKDIVSKLSKEFVNYISKQHYAHNSSCLITSRFFKRTCEDRKFISDVCCQSSHSLWVFSGCYHHEHFCLTTEVLYFGKAINKKFISQPAFIHNKTPTQICQYDAKRKSFIESQGRKTFFMQVHSMRKPSSFEILIGKISAIQIS